MWMCKCVREKGVGWQFRAFQVSKSHHRPQIFNCACKSWYPKTPLHPLWALIRPTLDRKHLNKMLAVKRVDISNYIFCKTVPVALRSDGMPSQRLFLLNPKQYNTFEGQWNCTSPPLIYTPRQHPVSHTFSCLLAANSCDKLSKWKYFNKPNLLLAHACALAAAAAEALQISGSTGELLATTKIWGCSRAFRPSESNRNTVRFCCGKANNAHKSDSLWFCAQIIHCW